MSILGPRIALIEAIYNADLAIRVPSWVAGEIGYLLAIVGFLVLVCEWWHVYRTQGSTLARDALRTYLRDWREAEDAEQGTAEETRRATVRRMQETVASVNYKHHRDLFTDYVNQLARIDPADGRQLERLDRAFAAGTPIEEWAKRPWRRRLMLIGAVMVVIGNALQMVSTYPNNLGPFYRTDDECKKCP